MMPLENETQNKSEGNPDDFEEDKKNEEVPQISQKKGKYQVVKRELQSIISEMNADADGGEQMGTTESQVEEETKAKTEAPI